MGPLAPLRKTKPRATRGKRVTMIRDVTLLFSRHNINKPVLQLLPSRGAWFHSCHPLARHGGRVSELQINSEPFHRVPSACAPASWGLPSLWSDFCSENCRSFLEYY
jgi:hypothetical protein